MDRESIPGLLFLVVVPVLMSVLSMLKHRKYRKQEFLHLNEFYLSMSLVAVSSLILIPMGPAFIIVSMLPWPWTLRTIGHVVEDISRESLFSRYHFLILGVGSIISIILLSFDFSVAMVATPFSLSVGLIGLTFVFQAYSKGIIRDYGFLHHLNFFLILSYFVYCLSFPVLISNNDHMILSGLLLASLLMVFCATLFPLYAELVFEKHEQFLEDVLHTRNRQLFSHSGFSEYRILSAGLSHEVNNALSIINAKIAMLIRGKSKDVEGDLRIIQGAANRIVRGMRGLREFIYPQKISEVLDLGEVVNQILTLYGQRLTNHGVRVEVSGLAGRLVKGQRVEIEQVFLSLINNSVEAVDLLEEKWITIKGKATAEKIEIHYQDSSLSKAEEIIPLMRDPFYAAQEFMDKDIRLVLAKEIIEKHGGQLVCIRNSEFSSFVLTLPLADALRSTQMELQNKIEEINLLH